MFRRATSVSLLAAALLAVPSAAVAGSAHTGHPAGHHTPPTRHHPVVLFAADGMRPDLMQKYAGQGRMPTYASLMRQGATGANGLTQGFPPNTGQGWYTLATGAWPGVHGSTNNTFFDNRQPFTASDSFSFHGNGASPGSDPSNVLEAQSVASAAEAAGKTVAQVDFTGGLNANIDGPTVDYDTFYSTRGVLEAPLDASKQASAAKFGLSYQAAGFTPAKGWTHVPASSRPAQQTQLVVKSSSPAVNPDRTFDLYVYATRAGGYDRALLVPAGAGKDGRQAAATLVPGRYSPVKLTLSGAAAGETAGFYVKVMTLARDLSRFGLYFTSVTRANAHCATAACDALPAGAPGEDRLAKYVNDNLPPAVFGDFAPAEAGLIDEDTWYEQTVGLNRAYEAAVLKYVVTQLQPDTDVLLAGTDETDEVSHQILGLLTPTAPDGSPNPYYDRLAGTGPRDGRLRQREAYLAGAYASADEQLGLVRRYLGRDADILASADHGFAPQWLAVDAALPLERLGLQDVEQTSNCRPAAASAPGGTVAKQCEAGGTAQIYLDLKGRNPDGVLDPADYAATVRRIVDAYRNLTDPATGKSVIEKVLTKAEMADVDGSDSLNPTRTGDVVVIARPPYQFDGATVGTLVAPSQFFGQHGYLPDQVDLAHNINMHAAFVAGGPDIDHVRSVAGVRAVDLAPTLAVLGGFDPPLQAQGRVLTSILRGGGRRYVTGQLLGINDVHGNITGKGLTQTDPFTGVTDAAGGLGVLATYLEQARATERHTVTVEAGDVVGASPPESALLRDKPTLDAVDLMHVDVGTLGNHEFDRGVPEMLKQIHGGTSTVDPSVTFDGQDYPVVDANVISDATGRPLLRPYVVKRIGGVPVAFIGATTTSTPSIVTTGGTAGVHFTDEATAVNGYVRQLQRQGVHAFVAVIHEGGTQSTYPVGAVSDPIATITRKLDPAVKVVIAGHSHTVLDSRIGGRLVVQASSYSRAFDQVHLLLDRHAGTIAASWGTVRTAWQTEPPVSTDPLGTPVRPDPKVQAVVDAAVQATNPITQEVINHAAADVPSQREGGATAAGESPAGDLIADAQRAYAGTQLAFVNTGSVRAGLRAGPVTYGDLFTMQPFQDDYLDTFTLTGAQVWALLRQQLAAGTGGIMQVSGLHFTYTGAQGAGSITGVWLGAAGDDSTPIPDSSAVTYTGTANSFMVGGGDGFTVLEQAGNIVQTPDAELVPLVDYVRGLSDPFSYATDGRITRR